MDRYQHRRHNKNLLMAHLILVTKYRKPLLLGDFRKTILTALHDTCRKNHWYIIRMETDRNHVHILLQYNPTDSVTHIVSILKQLSTWKAWECYADYLCRQYWKEHTLWSDGYFAASIGHVSQSTIEHSIENQG